MNTPEKTSKNGTYTSEGFVPHYHFETFKLPVKLDIPENIYSIDDLVFTPLKKDNQFVYALPLGNQTTAQELRMFNIKSY